MEDEIKSLLDSLEVIILKREQDVLRWGIDPSKSKGTALVSSEQLHKVVEAFRKIRKVK